MARVVWAPKSTNAKIAAFAYWIVDGPAAASTQVSFPCRSVSSTCILFFCLSLRPNLHSLKNFHRWMHIHWQICTTLSISPNIFMTVAQPPLQLTDAPHPPKVCVQVLLILWCKRAGDGAVKLLRRGGEGRCYVPACVLQVL